MLKKRLIVSLLWRNGALVQSINFKHTNVVGSVFTAIEFFNAWEADEIVLLNVGRQDEDFECFLAVVKALATQCFVPLSVGGWINSLERARKVIKHGADKIVINTQAYKAPDFIAKLAREFGSQCVIVSIDARKHDNGQYELFVDRGREATGIDPSTFAQKAENRGAGEILITSIDHDGSKKGYDLILVNKIVSAVNLPVIAFGGVGQWDHMVQGIQAGGAEAVAAGNIFHFYEHSSRVAKRHLADADIEVRSSLLNT